MEKDDELKGIGNSYTTEFRQYDPRVGRWLSLEPKPVAWESPFAFSRNNPILFNDPRGDCPDGNCIDVNYVQADQFAQEAISKFGNNIIGSTHNKDVVDKVYNYIANKVAKKYGILSDQISTNYEAYTFLTLTVSMACDRAYSQITNPKLFEIYEIALSDEETIEGKFDVIIDRYNASYKNQTAWQFTLLILESGAAAEGAASTGVVGSKSARVSLRNIVQNKLANSLKEAAKARVKETSKIVAEFSTSNNLFGGKLKYTNGHTIEILAEETVKEKKLILKDIVFYAKDVKGNVLKNKFGGKSMLETLDKLKEYAKKKGYNELQIIFKRGDKSSSAKPGKTIDKTFKL